jgi:hypothetical protein
MNQRPLHKAFSRLAARLRAEGLRAESWVVPAFDGLRAYNGGSASDAHGLTLDLGPSAGARERSTYALAISPLRAHPNLALTFLVSLSEADCAPCPAPAVFDLSVDRAFSTIFLPTLFTELPALDPTGLNRGVIVQSYDARLAPSDLLHAAVYTGRLLFRFKRDGQLALIAVDYDDALQRLIARAAGALRLLLPDVHLIPRAAEASAIPIPIPRPEGGHHLRAASSAALDAGLAVALSYLRRHNEVARRRPEIGSLGGSSP